VIVALTGGTGFLGGHVMAALVAEGHEVRALTRKPQPRRAGVSWIEGALDQPASLIALVIGANAVIHCAGIVNAPDPAGFDRGNRVGTANMIAAAQASSTRLFVHISSLAAREPQLSAYGASKRAAEDLVMASALDWRVIRPPAIYGPGDTDNLELFKFARRGVLPLPPPGKLSLIHAEDLARLVLACLENGESRTVYEPDDGRPGGWTHADYAAAIGDAVGRRPLTLPLPGALLNIGAAIDRTIRGDGAKLTRDRVAYMTHPDWVCDPARRPPETLWVPAIATTDGLRATAAWYREAGWL